MDCYTQDLFVPLHGGYTGRVGYLPSRHADTPSLYRRRCLPTHMRVGEADVQAESARQAEKVSASMPCMKWYHVNNKTYIYLPFNKEKCNYILNVGEKLRYRQYSYIYMII